MNSKLISVVLFLTTVAAFQGIGEVQSYSLEAGQNAVGVTLIKPAWLSGAIGAVDTAGMRVQDFAIPAAAASAPLLWDTVPAYLEISSSPANVALVGERYEVVVTANPGTNQGWISLRNAPWNTRQDLPAGLVGASYTIRPHWTLANLFGNGARSFLRTARTSASADEVLLPAPNTETLQSFFLCSDPATKGWRLGKDRKGPEQSQSILAPGMGLLIHAKGPLVFSLYGEARKHALRRPLQAGQNLVSLGQPQALRLGDLITNTSTPLRAESVPALADGVSFLSGVRHERFYPSLLSGKIQWLCTTSTYPVDVGELEILGPNRAFWIQKRQADPNFAVPFTR